MEEIGLTKKATDRLKSIHQLSLKLNGSDGNIHEEKLLLLMREHIDEVEDLRSVGDDHYLTETGDLLILCFELLLENKQSIDTILYKCFERYDCKLNKLIQEKNDGKSF